MNISIYEDQLFYERAYAQANTSEGLIPFIIHSNMEAHTHTIVDNGFELTDELLFQVKFWSHSLQYAISDWITAGFPYSPDEFASLLDGCRPALLQRVMDEPVLKRRAARLRQSG